MSKNKCVYCRQDVEEEWHALCDGCLFDRGNTGGYWAILVMMTILGIAVATVLNYVF